MNNIIDDFVKKLNSIGIECEAEKVMDLPFLGRFDYTIRFEGASRSGAFLLGKVKDNFLTLHRRIGGCGEDIQFHDNLLELTKDEEILQIMKKDYLKISTLASQMD
jgi:hypothetical protein